MTQPRVSVLIPTYNRSALLREAVDSVLAQSYRDFEIIVVDDGSTDDTQAAMAAYEHDVRYLRQQNQGVNAARNFGMRHARGEYVALLDSDDLWEPYKLELQVALLDRFPEVAFTFSDFFILKGARRQVIPQGIRSWHGEAHDWSRFYRQTHAFASLGVAAPARLARRDFSVHAGDVYAASLVEPFVLPSATLLRRSAVRHGLQFTESDSTCGDWEYFARLSHDGGALYADLETTYNRSHEDAVRLTRINAAIQLQRRVAMIDRVWRADPVFVAQRGRDVDAVQSNLLLQLGKMHLLASRNGDARASLRRAAALRRSGRSPATLAFEMLAWVPGSGLVLNALRSTTHAARRLVQRTPTT